MIYKQLFSQRFDGQPVRAGVIGTGQYATAVVTQSPYSDILDVPVSADLDVGAARQAYLQAGYAEEQIAICKSHSAAVAALEAGKRVVVPDAMLALELPLDVIVEATGAALLFGRFCLNVPEGTAWYAHLPTAAWQAIFHSVSAFCNAGFSIWDTSLAAYVNDWWVNMVFVLLIVLGGLGFFVLADVERWLRSLRSATRTKLRFQSHVVLFATFLLIAGGAILIWLGERSNMDSLGRKSLAAQGMVSVFHSVTARTAGFNTVRISEFSHFSVAVLIILMFIGASPGSCGGGVKTTTFAVLMTLALGAFRPRRDPSFRNRTFSPVVVRSAIALFFAAGAIVLFGALFLMAVETGGQAMRESEIQFAPLLFEAMSAFGTVGLTTGITPTLGAAAKLCLIALMFLGRVGPLGLISATLRGGARPVIRYPYEDIQIG